MTGVLDGIHPLVCALTKAGIGRIELREASFKQVSLRVEQFGVLIRVDKSVNLPH